MCDISDIELTRTCVQYIIMHIDYVVRYAKNTKVMGVGGVVVDAYYVMRPKYDNKWTVRYIISCHKRAFQSYDIIL